MTDKKGCIVKMNQTEVVRAVVLAVAACVNHAFRLDEREDIVDLREQLGN